ncbi:hypothetical protein, conserved [Eimeria tenella]|uniref:Uncharacterized protein n=1 Tax=Eimeria tenella TaxID=5802 RepID=U6KL96_EIMTE|nr:hypothetical protein, conserved [Eimeria tenella]CDJ37586.1 hypothetical protein, conserved [Eimeria tenella]|eukprot:XP_013228424.1 hypothetical protein, conserved [Eimeria tenella]
MLLPAEVVAALLATFTASRICQYCRLAEGFVRSIWLAVPLGGSEGKKVYIHPKLSLVQLRLLRTNLVYRFEAFRRQLPLIIGTSAALAAALCLPEFPLHRLLGLNTFSETLHKVVQQWAFELVPHNFKGVSSSGLSLVVACCCCCWLLLLAAAAAAAVGEVEGLKAAIEEPSKYVNKALWAALGAAAPSLPAAAAAAAFWIISPSMLKFIRISLAAAALLLRISAAKDLVQVSLLRQSNELSQLLQQQPQQQQQQQQKNDSSRLMRATQCVSLANRTTSVRAAEVLLLPVLLLLLLLLTLLFSTAAEVAPPAPPPFLNELVQEEKTNLDTAAAAAAAANACTQVHAAAAAAADPAAAAAGCCHKTSLLEEALCPEVYVHLKEQLSKEGKSGGKKTFGIRQNEKKDLGLHAHAFVGLHAHAFVGLRAHACACSPPVGPFLTVFRPFFLLFFGNKKEKEEAFSLFGRLQQIEAMKWREGPSEFSIWGPEVLAKRKTI